MQEAFELSHILYMVIILSLTVAALVLVKKFCKTKKSLTIAIYISAGLLLAVIIWNRISLAVLGEVYTDANGEYYSTGPDARFLMPYSYCSMTSLLLSICAMAFFKNRNHPVFHCLIYIGLLGGFATTVYPGMIVGMDSTIFATRTLSGMLHHSLTLYLSLLLLVTLEFKPNWRMWWCFVLGCGVYLAFGLLQIQAFGMEHSMEINKPFVDDTILTWYGGFAIIAMPFMLGFSLCWEYLPKLMAKYQVCDKIKSKVCKNKKEKTAEIATETPEK